MDRLTPFWDEVRGYLGVVALLVVGLPTIVLVLTLLADYSRPQPLQSSNTGDAKREVVHRQDSPEGRQPGRSGEEQKVHSLGRRDENGSPAGGSETDRTDPTRQTVGDSGGASGGQEPSKAAAYAPATSSTATAAAPAPTPVEPAPMGAPTPVATATAPATAPATTSAPAPTPMATASPEAAPASESSTTPAISAPISAPVEVPVDGVQSVVADPQFRSPSE